MALRERCWIMKTSAAASTTTETEDDEKKRRFKMPYNARFQAG
jgi:hypothetical protein